MKKLFALLSSLLFFPAVAAAPEGWFSDPTAAKAAACERNLPVVLLLAGGEWNEDSVQLRSGLLRQAEFRQLLAHNSVPLYVELEPASRWSAEFRKKLKTDYPFLEPDEGVPVPSFYFIAPDFSKLPVQEPRYTTNGFSKALKVAALKLQNRPRPVSAVSPVPAVENAVPEKTSAGRSKEADIRKTETAETFRSSREDQPGLMAQQRALANRQRMNVRDRKLRPPVNWLTDPASARSFAAKRNLPIIILFSGSDWCGPCMSLRKKVLDKSNVQKMLLKKAVPLYVHVPPFNRWDAAFREQMLSTFTFLQRTVSGVPSFYFVDSNFNLITPAPRVRERSLKGLSDALDTARQNLK